MARESEERGRARNLLARRKVVGEQADELAQRALVAPVEKCVQKFSGLSPRAPVGGNMSQIEASKILLGMRNFEKTVGALQRLSQLVVQKAGQEVIGVMDRRRLVLSRWRFERNS